MIDNLLINVIDLSFHHLFPKLLIKSTRYRYRLSLTSREGWGKIKVKIVILKTFFQTSPGQGQLTDWAGFVVHVCIWVFTSNYPMGLMGSMVSLGVGKAINANTQKMTPLPLLTFLDVSTLSVWVIPNTCNEWISWVCYLTVSGHSTL